MLPYVRIIRPGNALMAALAVLLGFWLAGGKASLGFSFLPLMIAAAAAVAYGNVVNDIHDLESDRISHADRPLPKNEIPVRRAAVFAALCAIVSLASALCVSGAHAAGALIPILLLTLYAFYLKATPLWGNIIISALVAYPLIFGGLHQPSWTRLYVPAALAFLLNLAREMVKDYQDEAGDIAAGVFTTAVVPERAFRMIIVALSVCFFGLIPLPVFLGHFGRVYCLLCIFPVLPLHGAWLLLCMKRQWRGFLSKISMLIKIEMLGGLLALAADKAGLQLFGRLFCK